VPYERQRERMASQHSAELEFKTIKNNLSQSLDCKNRQLVKFRRCKTLHKDYGKGYQEVNSL
jgi:hypothetical protein